jgi:hypothetical protein
MSQSQSHVVVGVQRRCSPLVKMSSDVAPQEQPGIQSAPAEAARTEGKTLADWSGAARRADVIVLELSGSATGAPSDGQGRVRRIPGGLVDDVEKDGSPAPRGSVICLVELLTRRVRDSTRLSAGRLDYSSINKTTHATAHCEPRVGWPGARRRGSDCELDELGLGRCGSLGRGYEGRAEGGRSHPA